MPPLIEVRGLTQVFRGGSGRHAGPVRALEAVDLEVAAGETLGIVGESGCGKTTLARCLVGLVRPTAGTVCFDGVDLARLGPAELRRRRREFQIIFQDPSTSLDPRMTVAESLEEPFVVQRLGNGPEQRRRRDELLEAVGLPQGLCHRKPAELSGGEQQRVVIARALLLGPRLVVADEPTSALDASVAAQVLNLLAELGRRYQLTLVLISHSLETVHYLADRVAVMYLGRIVETGPAGEFFDGPLHPYSQALLRAAPLGGEPASPARPPEGCHFHPRCDRAEPRCRESAPSLTRIGEKSSVACFLYTREHSLS